MLFTRSSAKPSRSDERLYSRRLLLARLVVVAGALVLIARLAWLQIYRFDHYSGLSSSNSIRADFLTPARGRIFDREGQILATNQTAFSLEVLPSATDDVGALIDEVRSLIDLPSEDEREFFESLPRTPLDGVNTALLKANLSRRELAVIASQLHRLDGLSIGNFLRRIYPDGRAVSAVIGHLGRITPEDWQRLDQKRYSWNGFIGKTGLELQYEDRLYGRPGTSYVEIDAYGRIHRELDRKPPKRGMDLHTSISLDLQRLVSEAMESRRGAALAIEPATGEVLLLYSGPSYDGNERLSALMGAGAGEGSHDDPLFNRATSGVYPPASTLKPVLALHPLLQEGLPVEESLECTGRMRIGRRTFRDWRRGGHGDVDLYKAIAESCDVYFYRNALLLGPEGIAESMHRLGFGVVTGIDLPMEGEGLVPTAAWKQSRYRDEWRPGDTANAGIGQGYVLATPLQLLAAVATLANRGEWVRPRLFRSWAEPVPQGEAEAAIDPAAQEMEGSRRFLPDEWLQRLPTVLQGMRGAVHSEDGTARGLGPGFEAIGVEVAGKTGTAQVVRLSRATKEGKEQNERLKDHSLFIGFAPFEDPQIAVAVVIENAGSGSAVAAPLAGRIMHEWLRKNPVSPEDEAGEEPSAE